MSQNQKKFELKDNGKFYTLQELIEKDDHVAVGDTEFFSKEEEMILDDITGYMFPRVRKDKDDGQK